MRDTSLLIVALGAVLVSLCSSKSTSVDESDYDEPIRMASESLVVKSYKDAESTTVSTTASLGTRLEEYQVYQGVMGRPGVDFPVYSYIPATKFSCRGVKKSGYYADLATDCQVFHICDGNRKISFLCPNGTIFRQSHLICDWWFRVDCDKSVELYEESAEQLAADQKIYKARSEERERRRKQGKALIADNGGELTSSEVYALDEPFHKKPLDKFVASTPRSSTVRFENRKPERHSKKVVDSGNADKFPNYKNGRVTEKSRTVKYQQEVTQFSTPTPRVAFVENIGVTTPSQKNRYQPQNSLGFDSNKENIQPAESGSLVEDLNRHDKFGYYNSRDQGAGSYNSRTEEQKNSQGTTEKGYNRSDFRSSVSFNQQDQNKRTEQSVNTGYNAQNGASISVNRQSSYITDKRTEQAYNIAGKEFDGAQGAGGLAQKDQRVDNKNNNFGFSAEVKTSSQTSNQGAVYQQTNQGSFAQKDQNFGYNTATRGQNNQQTTGSNFAQKTDQVNNRNNIGFTANIQTNTNSQSAGYNTANNQQTNQAAVSSFAQQNQNFDTATQTSSQTSNQQDAGNSFAQKTDQANNRNNFGYNADIKTNSQTVGYSTANNQQTNQASFAQQNQNLEYTTAKQTSSQTSNQAVVNSFAQMNDQVNNRNNFGYNADVKTNSQSAGYNVASNQQTNQATVSTFAQQNQNLEYNTATQTNNQQTNQASVSSFAQKTDEINNRNSFGYKADVKTNSQSAGYNVASNLQTNQATATTFAQKTDHIDNRNFGYNAGTQAPINTFEQTRNNEYNTERQTISQSSGSNFAQKSGQIDNNFGYNTNKQSAGGSTAQVAANQNNFGYTQTESTNREGKSFQARTEQTLNTNSFDFDTTAYTTEFFNYESKRTNPIERHETVTPTAHTRKTQSSRYRSSTPAYIERPSGENQHFAETASFASNRGSKSFSDFQNQFVYNKPSSTTPDIYKTTFYQTPKPTEGFFSSTPAPYTFSQQTFTTPRPVKQNSRKVTVFPSTNPQTVWQTTTFLPETTTIGRVTADDVYFTTPVSRETEIATENYNLGVSQNFETQTGLEYLPTTSKPDVDITLQELNINKDAAVGNLNKTYEDFVREGLEVPPSSGPNALRSFALYFANNQEPRTTYLPVTSEGEVATTYSPFEIKKKEIVKQVDEIVQNSTKVTEHHDIHTDDTLPNSLTVHTQESYSALFPSTTKNITEAAPSTEFETTAFESFTEEPYRINKELTKNDLDGSQSRGLVEPDTEYSKVSPDLRELAQVFTKALSAYLDDPEAFRRVLSEIRPTEPTLDSEISSSSPIEYPSATQEDDEVLDFSDVTKSTYKKKSTTIVRETTTEYYTEPPTTNTNDIENFVLPVNQSSWATNIELTAPLFESLDQSQSSYYTAPPFVGTTNAIAEEINSEFQGSEKLPPTDSNETVDSYLPIRGSVDDPSLPRYGGFQNNTKTTKYVPYGADLTSTTYQPYGADLTAATEDSKATTFNPNNVTSFFSHFSKNETEEGEIQLAKELNNLVLLQKFTTPRGAPKETTTPEPSLSTLFAATQNDINYQDIKLGNGETIEKNTRAGKSLHFPETDISSNYFEPNPKEINLELSPPSSTPKGFLITFSIGSSSEPATYLPKATTPEVQPTTYSPNKVTTFAPETTPPTPRVEIENFDSSRSSTEFYTTITPTPKPNSIDRLTQLQETLMFNTNNVTTQQRDLARVSVVEMMDTLNMTDSTANTLMKVMEMAAKNETYRRLVLLLVNDKSGKNKTVEEARVSLLKALLTPVINPHQTRTVLPIPETRLIESEPRQRSGSRRSKSISSDVTGNVITTTPLATTQRRPSSRRVKVSRGLTRAESNYNKSGLGNLGLIRRTIENSKNKQVKINSVDDAILDSDSRAVELLRSLYSLAARWG